MKIYSETTLREFSFWAGAVDTAKYLSISQLDTIENILEDIYSDSMRAFSSFIPLYDVIVQRNDLVINI